MRRMFVVMLGVVGAMAITAGLLATIGGAATTTKTIAITSSHCPRGGIFCYKPTHVYVARGTKVIWKNADEQPHTVTRCTKATCGVSGGTGHSVKVLASPVLRNGQSYSFVFGHAGTYVYYCRVHGYVFMHGTITVER